MSEVTIRRARADELTEIGRLTVAAYQVDGFVAPTSAYATKLADAETRFRESELLVAVDTDDTLLGTVTIAPPGSPLAQVATAEELEFRMLAVAANARGRGVGEALTRAVLDRAAELRLTGVVLSSSPDMTTAHRVYQRLGFQRTPERDWYPLPDVRLITYRAELR